MSYQREISTRPVVVVNPVTDPVNVKQENYPTLPDRNLTLKTIFLRNGGDPNQAIDTSGGPQEWSHTLTVDSLVYGVTILSVATGVVDILDYGNIAGGLTNGVQFSGVVGGVPFSLETPIFRWIDYGHASSAALNELQLNGNATQDIVGAKLNFPNPILCPAGSIFTITTEDNLSTLDYQQASLQYSELP